MSHRACWLFLALTACGSAAPTPPPKAGDANDAPEISRSVGAEDGVIVFWPRVIPRSDDPAMEELAARVQNQLASATKRAGGKQLDVRPAPERVCPRDGCLAATVGAALLEVGGGCVVVGLVARPGAEPTTMVPWVGDVRLATTEVPFREPPESQVTIVDAVPCDEVGEALGDDTPLVEAVAAIVGE